MKTTLTKAALRFRRSTSGGYEILPVNIKSDADREVVGTARTREMATQFAAAPELLAALIEFVQCNDGEHTIEMYHCARAAIAKAEDRNAD